MASDLELMRYLKWHMAPINLTIDAIFTDWYPKRSIMTAESREYNHKQNKPVIVNNFNTSAFDMLMLSSRHLGPMHLVTKRWYSAALFDKWKEIRRIKNLKIFNVFGLCQKL